MTATTPTVGSLCSGYGGLDMAAEQVTGGETVWFCEYDAAPSKLLAHRFPDMPNFGDLKALEWADHPVDLLTAGYPCQPFSGAGKRLGTDDPRHLFPWIVQGVERMRPALLLFENVRGHLSLGFDVVLAELDRIGYDVRWTLLRAADVGAPHGRSRLWIAARAREVGGWPAPMNQPSALAEDGGWVDPASGLFGSIPAQRPGTAGVMVRGVRWDHDAALAPAGVLFRTPPVLLPTPRATRGGSHSETRDLLMPTPRTTDTNGAGAHGDGGLDLRTAVSLLPTPAATDAKGARNSTSGRQEGSQHHSGDTLNDLVFDGRLLATPRSASTRTGRSAAVRQDSMSAPSLDQCVEIAQGILPREFDSWDELPASWQPDGRLLPTPAVNDMGAGKTVEDWDAWTETQRAKHGNGNGHGPSLHIEAARLALLPTPQAHDAAGAKSPEQLVEMRERTGAGVWNLNEVAPHQMAASWGPYAAAVARWGALTRPAPPPTEAGRNGPRLSPAFVEWMQGLPAGWVTDVPGVSRNDQLKMLGNGVVSQCAVAAYTLLGVADLATEAAA